MGKFDRHNHSAADIMRRQRETERQQRTDRTARRMEAAAIGRGGVILKDGGAIRTADFDGSGLNDPGSQGAWFGAAGLIVNEAVFRRGIIVPDALSDPTETRTVYEDAVEGPSNSGELSAVVPVPSWADRASAIVIGNVSGTAGIGDSTQFAAWSTIGELDGNTWPGFVSEPEYPPTMTVSAPHAAQLEPMEQDPFVQIAVKVSWGAQGMTELTWVAGLTAIVTFWRHDEPD